MLAFAAGAAAQQAGETLETVTVTGTRIKTSGFDAPTPTTVVSEEELHIGGRMDIGTALADLPQFRLTQSATSTNVFTTSGITPADLRGLGSQRTLVLVNNRRYVSAGDLQAVPYSVVKRIDVVTGGVSAAYGSDAVAGVVNIILDDEKEGFEFGVQPGISTHGDGEKYLVEGSGGVSFADGRGHALFAADWLKDTGVTPGITRPRVGGALLFPGEDGLLYPTRDIHEALRSEGGLINTGVLAGQTFEPDGSLRPFQYGRRTPLAPVNMEGGEGFYIDDIASLSAPIERANVFGRATYDLTDTATVWIEGVYNRAWDERPWFAELTIGQLTFAADNPFLSTDIQNTLAAAGETSFTMGRVLTDVAVNEYDYDDTTYQISVGIDGTFADGTWKYDAYYGYGKKTRNQRVHNLVRGAEFFNAIDAVRDPVSGEIVCRVALTDPGTDCAPLNLFGSGVASQAAIDYVTGSLHQEIDNWLHSAGISFSGEPFSFLGQPVAVAFGAEYRKNSFAHHYNEDALAGSFLLIQGVDIDKKGISVKEGFGEVAVPLLVDAPLAQNVTFNGAVRISDYSKSGAVWSWKVGGTWDVNDDVRFRLTRSRDIRAPVLEDFFTPASVFFTAVTDLGRPGSPVTPVVAHAGGNPELKPELADTWTVGLLLSPAFLPGFQFSVDYYDIEINEVISRLSPQLVVNSCYNEGNQAACDQLTRDGTGALTDILITGINIARFQTKGFDFEASYQTTLERLGLPGTLSVRGTANHADSMTLYNGITTIEGAGYTGSFQAQAPFLVPDWRATLTATYESDRVGGDIRFRYINDSGYAPDTVLPNIGDNSIDARLYVDLGFRTYMSFAGDNQLTLYGTIQNLFDTKPPVAAALSPYFDLVGRYFTIGARVNF